MKVYIGDRNIDDDSFKKIPQPELLATIADDSECTSIILDNILKRYNINEIPNLLNKTIKKLRIGGSIVICDLDFDLLIFGYKKVNDINAVNNIALAAGPFKSFITYKMIIQLMAQYPFLQLESANYNNMEFKMEFIRKS
jgi:hypothetical protein